MQSNLSILLDMLTYCRPSDSRTEYEFLERFIVPLPDCISDLSGNYHVIIGDSPIVWSCHTDTVHSQQGRQTVSLNPCTGIVSLSRRSRKSWCLGADDTAGVFILHQMILQGVPGHYIFHYAEEIGGIGSDNLSRSQPELLDGCQYAIALDRKGTRDVITHQQFGRCCSEAFASSLAVALNRHNLDYRPSAHGSFTDTANYTDLVGECTNLSVGYEHAHTSQECLDVHHVQALFTALCALDVERLVSERKPREQDSDDLGFGWLGAWRQQGLIDSPQAYFLYEDCEYCGKPYRQEDTAAIDVTRYCSADCEHSDGRLSAKLLMLPTERSR